MGTPRSASCTNGTTVNKFTFRAHSVPRVSAAWGVPLLLAIWFALAGSPLWAQAWEAGTDGLLPIPPLAAHVTDLTHSLSPTEAAALEAKLVDWEARTSNQLVVLLVPTTLPEPIESYSLRVAEQWKIGRKGQDNGAVFLSAKNDKKMRIEVGYGLEGVLTDVTARRIIAENVAPPFRDGRFAAGIGAGIDRIVAVVGEGKPLPPPQSNRVKKASGGPNLETLFVILFVAVPVVGGILRSIFGRLLGSTIGAGVVGGAAWLFVGSIAIAAIAAVVGFLVMIFFGMGGGIPGRGGGGWIPTGGGFGGGGFSGGGGSFGGGGASGDW